MAQTIASVKGTKACTWTTATNNVIFTQSTGTATRVIVNALEFSTGSIANFNLSFFIYNSTTGIYQIITLLKSLNVCNFAIFPQIRDTVQTSVSTTAVSNSVFMYQDSGGAVATMRDASAGNRQIGLNTASNTSYWFPGNFYMSNGDSLVVSGTWGSAGNTYYNFTTITES